MTAKEQMALPPLRILKAKIDKLVDSFGMEFSTDRQDIQPGRFLLLPPNGRFVVTTRKWNGTMLEVTFVRDKRTRKQRRSNK